MLLLLAQVGCQGVPATLGLTAVTSSSPTAFHQLAPRPWVLLPQACWVAGG